LRPILTLAAFLSTLLVGVFVVPFSLILCWLKLMLVEPFKNAKKVWESLGKLHFDPTK
jgi:hypothetical protein